MSQITNWTIPNGGGSTYRAAVNAALAALQSCSSGASAPSPTVAGMFWFDTTNLILKRRNNANSAWIDVSADTIAANTLRGNPTGSAAVEQEITMTQLAAMLEASAGRAETLGAAAATASGTTVDFTSIPSYAREITVQLDAVTMSGTEDFLIQLGTSGGVETSSYSNTTVELQDANAIVGETSTSGFLMQRSNVGHALRGLMTLRKIATAENFWTATWTASRSTSTVVLGAGNKALAGALDRIRLARVTSNTFSAGRFVVGWR